MILEMVVAEEELLWLVIVIGIGCFAFSLELWTLIMKKWWQNF